VVWGGGYQKGIYAGGECGQTEPRERENRTFYTINRRRVSKRRKEDRKKEIEKKKKRL